MRSEPPPISTPLYTRSYARARAFRRSPLCNHRQLARCRHAPTGGWRRRAASPPAPALRQTCPLGSPQGQGACSASHPRWPEQRHYADVWTRAMSCFLHALLTPTSSPQLALRRILTARSSGFGAVKGWCSASSRPSSSFHSNMGKSTTHSRLCWPSCRSIGVQRGGSTRVHGRWRANKGTSGWSRRQWTRCGSQCTARCGESPALARRWLFGPCFCYRTAEHIQTTPVSPLGARANQEAPRHSAHAAALARGAST